MGTILEKITTWVGEKMATLSLQQCCVFAAYEPEMPEELEEVEHM